MEWVKRLLGQSEESDPAVTPSQAEVEEPEDLTFVEIGKSPVPGLTLSCVLRGHTSWIGRLAWSPDGSYIASPSDDYTTRLWDVRSGACVRTWRDQTGLTVAWSPDGRHLASSGTGWRIYILDVATGERVQTLNGHSDLIHSLAWASDGRRLASASTDKTVCLWDIVNGRLLRTLQGHTQSVHGVAWSPDGQHLASASWDKTVRVWAAATGELTHVLTGHTANVHGVAWSPDGRLASVSNDRAIRLWDATTGKAVQAVEGHTSPIRAISISAAGRLAASKSVDNTVRIWNTDTWAEVARLPEGAAHDSTWCGLAFHPHGPVLATLGEGDTIIRIWDVDEELLLVQAKENVHYTTAKVVLVGDSGVGKTGLGWRLAHGEFKEHASTHGQQFWAIPQLGLQRSDRTQCEAVLWDLAGQHVYRQIHSIFLENVAAALVLFDPGNRQEPLKGVQFWLEQLRGGGLLPPTILVGARVDRGGPALARQELEQFCQRAEISGGYMSTSAKSGEGLDALMATLRAQIPWAEMTTTVTTVTFKRIKDHVLALKETPTRDGVLVSPSALREQLLAADPSWRFTDAEMMAAVGHLETHGYVAVLRSSAGEQYVLLAPDLLVTLASSIVLLADKHPRELGALSETELLQGKYPLDELAGLSPDESQILMDAAILRFLQHNICFRETMGTETLLIFPGLIKQKRPLQDDVPSTDDISYVVRGRVENLYASLVVLLGYTPSFTRINQWQNQAQYELGKDEICGFRLLEDREGEIELVLYHADRMPESGRIKFQELFEQLLYQRDVQVTRFPPVVCPNKHRQKRATVIERVRERKPSMFCDECGAKVTLPDFDKPASIGIGVSPWLQREEAVAHLRSAYEVHLTKVKGYRRDWAVPRCYVSRHPDQIAWANALVHDLRDAGVYMVEDVGQVQPTDFVVVLDTPAYQKAFPTPALAADASHVRARLDTRRNLISLALTGEVGAHEFDACQPGTFADTTHYPVSLFDLVLNLYAVPLTHAGFAPLRQALHAQWEDTLARKREGDASSPLKIFISYSHQDEPFKNELVTTLAGLQRRGIVEAWQDRRIEAGDDWNTAIQEAMNDCDLALLLVSPDYLASRFIQEEEQPKLLQRRQELQLRVIPIIVRPCPWQSEPVLKDLQALPRDNKAVITFSKETGARDQVWTDIATVIEKRTKAATMRLA